jgi:hypothetical protein
MTPGGATAKVEFNGKQVAGKYTYWTEEDASDGAGWYLEADEDAEYNQNDVVLPFGTGFLVFRAGSEADATITFSGSVRTEPVTKKFPNAQYNIFGNCSPSKITLGDITVSEDFVSSTISFMTPAGATARVEFNGKQVAQSYTYWTEEDASDGAGWYLEADEDAEYNQNAVEIEAGKGFLVFRAGSEANATMTIPSAL